MASNELGRTFAELWHEVTGHSGKELYKEIAGRYSEPHRHYHTLEHIAACLWELRQLSLAHDLHQPIALAIWFHDAVYDPLARDNEARSAEFFQTKAIQAGMSGRLVERVSLMIEATKTHEAPSGLNGRATRLLIDIDLAILGASPDRFREYDEAIRREYSAMPGVLYSFKRKKVLQRFLDRLSLFCTPEFREKYERQARENLRSVVCQH